METDRFISILGAAAERLLFARMRGREILGQPFEYDLELLSEDFAVDLATVLGQSLAIRVTLGSGGFRYVHGVVTHFKLSGTVGRYARYQAVLRPAFWLLRRRANCRIFQRATVPEIVAAILGEHGFIEFSSRLQETYATNDFVVQYRESDFHFISRLLEREGIYYYFVHDERKHTLVLCDAPTCHDVAPGYASVPFLPHRQVHLGEECFDTWSTSMNLVSGRYALRDFNFENPAVLPEAVRVQPTGNAHDDMEVFDYPGLFDKVDTGGARAAVRLEQLQTQHHVVEGAGDLRGLSTGWRFALTEHPRDDQNGQYLVVSSLCDAAVNAYDSGSASQARFRCAIAAISRDQAFRAEPTTSLPRVDGPQTAIVVGPKGDEIWTDQYGRVKLQFHWDRYGTSDEKSSCWVRVSQAWAGTGWGSIQIPRIGQEVIVEFLDGDPDRPIVTGRVYNGIHMPPYDLPDKMTQSGVKTRSTPNGYASNGNEIRFEDRKGHEELYVQAERTHTVLVKGDQGVRVGGDRRAQVHGGEYQSVRKSRTTDVIIDDTFGVGNDQFTNIGNDQIVNIGANRIVDVGANHVATVKTDYSLKTADGQIALTHGESSINVAANEDVYVTTKNANVTATRGGNITISNGAASIFMSKDGDVLIDNSKGDVTIQQHGTHVTIKRDQVEVHASNRIAMTVGRTTVDLTGAGAKVTASTVEMTASIIKMNG